MAFLKQVGDFNVFFCVVLENPCYSVVLKEKVHGNLLCYN